MARPKPSLLPASAILAMADPEGRLEIRVTPNASADAVLLGSFQSRATLMVRTTMSPQEGKANAAVLRLLADALDRPVSSLKLMRGANSRTKLVRLLPRPA